MVFPTQRGVVQVILLQRWDQLIMERGRRKSGHHFFQITGGFGGDRRRGRDMRLSPRGLLLILVLLGQVERLLVCIVDPSLSNIPIWRKAPKQASR